MALLGFHMKKSCSIANHCKLFMGSIDRHPAWYDTPVTRVTSFQNLSLHHAVPVTCWLSREGENGLTGHSSAQLMPSLSTHCSGTTGKFTSNFWTLNFLTFHPSVCSTEALLQKHLEPASTVASWNVRIKTSPFTLVNDCCDDGCFFAFLDSFSGYYQLLLPTPILQLQVWLGTVQSIPLEIPQYCSHENDRIFPMKRTAPLLFFAIICDCSRGRRTDARTRTPSFQLGARPFNEWMSSSAEVVRFYRRVRESKLQLSGGSPQKSDSSLTLSSLP